MNSLDSPSWFEPVDPKDDPELMLLKQTFVYAKRLDKDVQTKTTLNIEIDWKHWKPTSRQDMVEWVPLILLYKCRHCIRSWTRTNKSWPVVPNLWLATLPCQITTSTTSSHKGESLLHKQWLPDLFKEPLFYSFKPILKYFFLLQGYFILFVCVNPEMYLFYYLLWPFRFLFEYSPSFRCCSNSCRDFIYFVSTS